METKRVSFNKNSLTAMCNGKVTQYKTFHAYQTAFLANIVGKVYMSYDHYTKSFKKYNRGGQV